MKKRRISLLAGPAAAAAVTAGVLVLYGLKPDVLEQVDSRLIDVKFRMRGPRSPGGAVALVAVDKKAVHDVGKWPWPRATIAALLDRISAGNPRVIGLDFNYTSPDPDPSQDRLLEEAMRRSGRVVGSTFFLISPGEARFQPQAEYEAGLASLRRCRVQVVKNLGGRESPSRALAAYGVEGNIPPVASALLDCGFYNVILDPDGSVRRLPLVLAAQGDFYYSFAVAAIKACRGTRETSVTLAGDFVEGIGIGEIEVPTDGRGRLFLNYYGGADAFPSHSAADVLRGAVSPDAFRDKAVLVGGTSTGVFDMRVSPFSPTLSSIAIQATCIENVLAREWLTESSLSRFLTLCMILLAGAVMGLLLPRLKSPLSGGALFLASLGLFAAFDYWLFASRGVQASAVYPSLAVVASYIAVSACLGFARERKNARLRTTLREVSETIDSITALEELLPGMLATVVGFLGAARGVLLLQGADGEEGKRLAPAAWAGIEPAEWESDRRAYARGVAARAAKGMQGVLVPDLRREIGAGPAARPRALRPSSALCVPLKAKGRLAGVIYAERDRGGGGFDPDDLSIVASFASQWGIAIENARLHGRLAAADARPREEDLYLRGEAPREERFGQLVGSSPAMQALYALIGKAVGSDITVLIEGETGTGKELVARTIHSGGGRKDGMFVAQNCAALPETLLESELFGHARGAFTGATADKKGLFEVADGGTIFLDEIGEMPLGMQAKLLRVIAEGKIRPVGGLKERSVDVRVLSATNRDLAAEVREGRFREDLYYRLNVFPIRVPPLRDRREDIPRLALHFLQAASERLGRRVKGFSADAMDLLCRYDFPGNVRELENEIERAIALGSEGEAITSDTLSEKLRAAPGPTAEEVKAAEEMPLKDAVGNFERRLIRDALRRAGGNKTLAAHRLGLTRQSLQHKIKLYRVEI